MNAMQDKQHNVMAEVAQDAVVPGLEIGLKAERVQEPQSLVAAPASLVCQLSVQPVQPVSITLSGTSVVFTLHGPGGAS